MIDEKNTGAMGISTECGTGILGEHCSTVQRKKPTGRGKGNAVMTFTHLIHFFMFCTLLVPRYFACKAVNNSTGKRSSMYNSWF